MIDRALANRAPLRASGLIPLPLTAVRPGGWLRARLTQTHAALAPIAPDAPLLAEPGCAHALSGALELAYILEDGAAIERARDCAERLMASQREDGDFGPEHAHVAAYAPRIAALWPLMSYYTATADVRVPRFMLRYFAYMARNIKTQPFEHAMVVRGGDAHACALWLYNLTENRFLLDLARAIPAQTLDWTGFFNTQPYTKPMERVIPAQQLLAGARTSVFTGLRMDYYATQFHLSRAEDIAAALRYPSSCAQLTEGTRHGGAFRQGYDKLMLSHGMPHGMFSGDDHLAGANPTRGTALAAVVNAIESCARQISLMDDPLAGDTLEQLAFSALPAAQAQGGTLSQRVQQINQVRASRAKRGWYSADDDANLFIETDGGEAARGYACYAQSLWMATGDGGLAALSYAPCDVRFRAGGAPVRVSVQGDYPYRDEVTMRFSLHAPAEFTLLLRIPAWARGASAEVAGESYACEPGDFARIHRVFTDGEQLRLHLPMTARVTRGYHQSASVQYGPLLMALPIKPAWKRLEEPGPARWQALPASPWNYALLPEDELCAALEVSQSDAVGDAAPLCLSVGAAPLPEWEMRGADAAQPPISPRVSKDARARVVLVPYGATTLRIAAFPVAQIEP